MLKKSILLLCMALTTVATPCFAVILDCGLDVLPALRYLDTEKPDFGVPGATVVATEQNYKIQSQLVGDPGQFYDHRFRMVMAIDRAQGVFEYSEPVIGIPGAQRRPTITGVCQPKTAPKF
jgi:hypothetical protein